MAITVVTLQRAHAGFALTGRSADASGCEEILAAPGVGKAIYLQRGSLSAQTATQLTLGAGETAGAVTSAILAGVPLATGTSIKFRFSDDGIKLADNTSLTIDSSQAVPIRFFVEGYVK